ncbi:hypothetical protein WI90_29780 [Burkholderia ubonensis]|nr:hypothetical protein WI90_29780 [Burkholderia ubonensis]
MYVRGPYGLVAYLYGLFPCIPGGRTDTYVTRVASTGIIDAPAFNSCCSRKHIEKASDHGLSSSTTFRILLDQTFDASDQRSWRYMNFTEANRVPRLVAASHCDECAQCFARFAAWVLVQFVDEAHHVIESFSRSAVHRGSISQPCHSEVGLVIQRFTASHTDIDTQFGGEWYKHGVAETAGRVCVLVASRVLRLYGEKVNLWGDGFRENRGTEKCNVRRRDALGAQRRQPLDALLPLSVDRASCGAFSLLA